MGSLLDFQRVVLYTDNEAVVNINNQGYIRDDVFAAIVRNIWLYAAEKDIQLQVLHIPGKQNTIADLLLRWEGMASQAKKLHELIDNPQWCKVQENYFRLNTQI